MEAGEPAVAEQQRPKYPKHRGRRAGTYEPRKPCRFCESPAVATHEIRHGWMASDKDPVQVCPQHDDARWILDHFIERNRAARRAWVAEEAVRQAARRERARMADLAPVLLSALEAVADGAPKERPTLRGDDEVSCVNYGRDVARFHMAEIARAAIARARGSENDGKEAA